MDSERWQFTSFLQEYDELKKVMKVLKKEFRSREVDTQMELLVNQFGGNENFNFNRKSLTNNLCKIVANLRLLTKQKRGKRIFKKEIA